MLSLQQFLDEGIDPAEVRPQAPLLRLQPPHEVDWNETFSPLSVSPGLHLKLALNYLYYIIIIIYKYSHYNFLE